KHRPSVLILAQFPLPHQAMQIGDAVVNPRNKHAPLQSEGFCVSHVKKNTKGSDFSKFYVYFCHVIDDFCLFLFATLR
ncbi:MAG: hypothetical protein II447_02810, partial [Bacteroidaceae bacterium]|nr:hypothetical protein [Bacteroidaceae bacterium]